MRFQNGNALRRRTVSLSSSVACFSVIVIYGMGCFQKRVERDGGQLLACSLSTIQRRMHRLMPH